MHRVLAEEACRIADRLERLDGLLSGRESEWLTANEPDASGAVRVVVDGALAEARQQVVALKGISAELRQATGRAGAERKPEAVGVADLTARIAARRETSG